MNALFLNCTLKPSPADSNTEALARVVADELERQDVAVEFVRLVDLDIRPGTEEDMGEGDQWPEVHAKVLEAQILVICSPTWLGHPSSVAHMALERLNSLLDQTGEDGLPAAFNRVAGVVVTGSEDGGHHVISEIAGGLIDIGYTVPGQAWTYWNQSPGPGPQYLEGKGKGHEWARETGLTAARNLAAVARSLQERGIPGG